MAVAPKIGETADATVQAAIMPNETRRDIAVISPTLPGDGDVVSIAKQINQAGRKMADLLTTADALHKAAIRLLRLLRREDAAAGLTGPQASALSVLTFGGPQTPSALAAAEQVAGPTMSRLLRDLQSRGFIRRSTQRDDKRSQLIAVTEKGRKLLEAGRTRRLQKLTLWLRELPPEERQVLARAAAILLKVTEREAGR